MHKLFHSYSLVVFLQRSQWNKPQLSKQEKQNNKWKVSEKINHYKNFFFLKVATLSYTRSLQLSVAGLTGYFSNKNALCDVASRERGKAGMELFMNMEITLINPMVK